MPGMSRKRQGSCNSLRPGTLTWAVAAGANITGAELRFSQAMEKPMRRFCVFSSVLLSFTLASCASTPSTQPITSSRTVSALSRATKGAQYIYVSSHDNTLKMFNAVSGGLEFSINHNLLYGLATNSFGEVYTAGDEPNAVQTYTPKGKNTKPTILKSYPFALAVDATGKIYVGTQTGKNGSRGLTTYTAKGKPTTPTIPSIEVTALAVDANEKIYALVTTKQDRQEVLTYLSDGSPTTPTISLGGAEAYGIAVDSSGKLYVGIAASSNGFGVITFLADGTPTTPTISLPEPVAALALDSTGKIYVADQDSITTYLPDGTQTTPTISAPSVPFAIAVH